MEENKNVSESSNIQSDPTLKNQVDILGICSKIWLIRRTLCKASLVGLVLGLFISLSMPKEYYVKVTLTPELSGKNGGGLANMAASFLGTSFTQASPDAINAQLAPEIVVSTPFLLQMLKVNVPNSKLKKDTVFSTYLDTESVSWWKYIMKVPRSIIEGVRSLFSEQKELNLSEVQGKGPIRLTRKQEGQLSRLRQAIAVNVDKKNSIITLHVKLQNPEVAAVIADSVVSKLQESIIAYKISKAEDDCAYWEKLNNENREKYYSAQKRYANYVDSNSNVIYQSTMVERERLQNEMLLAYQVYSQVEQQLQMAKAKVQESKPVFAVLEPTVVPNSPSGVGKLQLMIVYAILASVVTAVWLLIGKDAYNRFRSVVMLSE